MVPIKKVVIPYNNTIKQITPNLNNTSGLVGIGYFMDWAHKQGALKSVKFLAIRPKIDGDHTWPWKNNLNSKKVDFVRYIPLKYIKQIQQGELTLIFDAGNEAWDPINQIALWRTINENVTRYRLPKKNVWYFSSNTKDHNNTYPTKFLKHDEFFWSCGIIQDQDVDKAFNETVEETIKCYNDTLLYSSLNARDKYNRHKWHYLLYKNKLDQYGMISNPVINPVFKRQLEESFSIFHVNNFCKTLPRTVDDLNRNRGWSKADLKKDFHILDRSIFHIVNETFVYDSSSVMLVSEKTFKTFARFTPSIIFGMQGTQKILNDVGFKTFNSKFGLDTNWDTHPLDDRYTLALDAVKRTCEKLNTMNKTQRIDWKFKEEHVLKHNYKVLASQNLNNSRRNGFVDRINTEYGVY